MPEFGTSANIRRVKEALLERDLIDTTKPQYLEISDPILQLWLKHRVWSGIEQRQTQVALR